MQCHEDGTFYIMQCNERNVSCHQKTKNISIKIQSSSKKYRPNTDQNL